MLRSPGLALASSLLIHPVVALAAPGDVNAQAFYADALALQDKGMTAMFDKRLKPMMAQMKDAGARVKAENKAEQKRGRAIYCVPDTMRGKGLSSEKVIVLLGRVPERERRSMTLVEAWRAAMAREYPC